MKIYIMYIFFKNQSHCQCVVDFLCLWESDAVIIKWGLSCLYNCSQNLKYFAVYPHLTAVQGQANMCGVDLFTQTDGRAVQSHSRQNLFFFSPPCTVLRCCSYSWASNFISFLSSSSFLSSCLFYLCLCLRMTVLSVQANASLWPVCVWPGLCQVI